MIHQFVSANMIEAVVFLLVGLSFRTVRINYLNNFNFIVLKGQLCMSTAAYIHIQQQHNIHKTHIYNKSFN